ncbi:MAG: protein arginine kinase [Bacillota bacterium]|jgi:protein arginine kinase
MDEMIFQPKSKWTSGLDDIIISSRIRLARNLQDFSFPQRINSEKAKEILDKSEKAIAHLSKKNGHRYYFYRLQELNEQKKGILLEKHLISPPLLETKIPAAVAIREDQAVAIMFNEEDHLRIQCFLPAAQLEEAWLLASKTDDILSEFLHYAFDSKLGYLTSCPTNIGTGLRASLMLHLPGLVMSKQAAAIFDSMPRFGLTVRGIYGERTQGLGNLFQISNQVTLGQKEEDIINKLNSVVNQVMEQERQCRRQLQKKYANELYDSIWRSYGILANARTITSEEMMEKLSHLRLGVDMGIIVGITTQQINELMLAGQPNFINESCHKKLSFSQRDWERAKLIRKNLKNINVKEE